MVKQPAFFENFGWTIAGLGFACACVCAVFLWLVNRFGERVFGRPVVYERERALLSAAEAAFMKVLEGEVLALCPRGLRVMVKPRCTDLVTTDRKRSRGFESLCWKHVDFAIVWGATWQVVCAVELDDASHGTGKARRRDALVGGAFASARLPLLRVRCAAAYDVKALAAAVNGAVSR